VSDVSVVVEGVIRPRAYERGFEYLCPHCRTVTLADARLYDQLVFHRREGAAADFRLPAVFDPFVVPVIELIKLSVGDDFLAFRCTGCAAPVVAAFSRETPQLYRPERVYELRSWPANVT
jgi:hypothetical protein